MKCTQCDHEFKKNSKFCPECGAKQEIVCANCGSSLSPDARFCGECGTKVLHRSISAVTEAIVSEVLIKPLPASGLIPCEIEVFEVMAEGPDEDQSYRVTAKFRIINTTDFELNYLDTRIQLFSCSGHILEENRDNLEQVIAPGDSQEFESCFWGVKAGALGTQPDKAHIVVSFTGCAMGGENLGELEIPVSTLEPFPLKSTKISETLNLISGSLWKTDPDDEKECRVELKALVQNLTGMHLPQVRLLAEITDKAGREITDAGTYDEVRPGAVAVLSGSGYAKEKKLIGAKVDLALRAYWPVAAGVTQHQGLLVRAPEASSTAYGHEEDESSEQRGIGTPHEERDTDSMNSDGKPVCFEWFMKRGAINMDEVEDPETLETLSKVLNLTNQRNFEAAVKSLPRMYFEFSFHNLDGDASEYFSDTDDIGFDLTPDDPRCSISVGVEDGVLVLTASVFLELQPNPTQNLDDIQDWLADNGGYSAGFLSGGWSYHGDEGGHLIVST